MRALVPPPSDSPRPVVPLARDEYYREVTRLRQRIVTLECEIARLRDLFAPPTVFPQHWNLTPTEARVLAALAATPNARRKESLHAAMYEDREAESEIKIVDVIVCKLRAKLAAAGHAGAIDTIWGQGYRLAKPFAAALAAITAGVRP